MKNMYLIFTSFLMLSTQVSAQVPSQPTASEHPGSAVYKFTLKQEKIQLDGRRIDVFLPAEIKDSAAKAPVIVFGHGQAIDVAGYELTFQHLAKKGIVVIHPTYDSGFFDQDWRRMASDFNSQAKKTIEKYSEYIDVKKVIFAGHSKGAYVALMAAGAPDRLPELGSVVLFAPAGYDAEYLKSIDSKVPVTLTWSDADTTIKQNLVKEIYGKLQTQHKQFILVKSYSSLSADHFYPLSKSYFFGGQNGTSAFHYYAVWKWLVGAALDLQDRADLTNTYLYGAEAPSTGQSGLQHSVTRNW